MSAGGQKLLEIDDIASFLNKSWIDFWKGKDREDALKAISKASKGDTGIFSGYCETAKGTRKWWNVTVSPIEDIQGNCDRLLVVSRDVTDRKWFDGGWAFGENQHQLTGQGWVGSMLRQYLADAHSRWTLSASTAWKGTD